MTTLSAPMRTHTSLSLLWRSLVAGVGYFVFTAVGGMAGQWTGVPAPTIVAQMDPRQTLAGIFVAGVVMGLTLGPLTTRLAVPFWGRAAALFLLLYGVGTILSVVEALFFTNYITAAQLFDVSNLVAPLLMAGLLAWLFPPAAPIERCGDRFMATWRQRAWYSWLWRIALAGLLYVPTYLAFGMSVAPIVTPYYQDPALGLGLVIPGFDVMLPLEVLRGVGFVLAALPLVMLLRGPRWVVAGWIGLAIAVVGGWAPMLVADFMPPVLRITHGLEITADSFVQGLTIAWLLGVGPWRSHAQ
jgi:hypothetical protein